MRTMGPLVLVLVASLLWACASSMEEQLVAPPESPASGSEPEATGDNPASPADPAEESDEGPGFQVEGGEIVLPPDEGGGWAEGADLPSISFDSPGDVTTNPVILSVQGGGPVYKVKYFSDGYLLGTAYNPQDGFRVAYNFSQGGERVLKAQAYLENGNQVAAAVHTTYVLTEGEMAFVSPGADSFNPATLMVAFDGPIERVDYYVNGSFAGEGDTDWDGFPLSYSFPHIGQHFLEARGFGAQDELVASATAKTVSWEQPTLTFISPANISLNPVALAVSVKGPIARVRYYGDGAYLGQSETSAGGFPVATSALTPGGYRNLEARGYDSNDNEVVTATKKFYLAGVPKLKFTAPGSACTNPVKISVESAWPIEEVNYYAEGTFLGTSKQATNGFKIEYTFQNTGQRQLEARGYSKYGDVLNTATLTTTVSEPAPQGCPAGTTADCNGYCANSEWLDDSICDNGVSHEADYHCPQFDFDGGDCDGPACPGGKTADCNGYCAKSEWLDDGYCDNGENYQADYYCEQFSFDGGDCDPTEPGPGPNPGGVPDVPYFYQYANSLYPGSSCQNTALAMLLNYYGWNGTPDTITSAWGKNHAQTPSGLAQIFNSYAESAGISERLKAHTDGTIGEMQAMLAQGKPVIVHGYFTTAGHVMVTLGYDGSHYTANDPAGKWNQQFKGGYPYGWNTTIGDHIKYGKSAYELALASLNGSNYAPLWYHEVLD